MSDETPLMRKIRLLMAKAQDRSIGEAEASAFAAKVQELLLENNMSISDINMSAGDAPRESVQQNEQARGGRDFLKSPARRVLLQAVCKFYMCSYLRWGNSRVVIVGKPSNAEVAASMMNYLLDTVVRMSNSYASGLGNAARIDYRRGCMMRLAERLRQMTLERERAARVPNNSGSSLPVLFVNENQLVQNYMDGLKARTARPARVKHGWHAHAGRKAADGISLSPQVGNSSKKQRSITR